MNRYKVYVCLEADFDDIKAEDEEEAFIIASDFAMGGCEWIKSVELVEKDIEKSEDE